MSEHPSSPGNSEENPSESDFDDAIEVQFPDFMEDATNIPDEAEAAQRLEKNKSELLDEYATQTFILLPENYDEVHEIFTTVRGKIRRDLLKAAGLNASEGEQFSANAVLPDRRMDLAIIGTMLSGEPFTLATVLAKIRQDKNLKNVSESAVREKYCSYVQNYLQQDWITNYLV